MPRKNQNKSVVGAVASTSGCAAVTREENPNLPATTAQLVQLSSILRSAEPSFDYLIDLLASAKSSTLLISDIYEAVWAPGILKSLAGVLAFIPRVCYQLMLWLARFASIRLESRSGSIFDMLIETYNNSEALAVSFLITYGLLKLDYVLLKSFGYKFFPVIKDFFSEYKEAKLAYDNMQLTQQQAQRLIKGLNNWEYNVNTMLMNVGIYSILSSLGSMWCSSRLKNYEFGPMRLVYSMTNILIQSYKMIRFTFIKPHEAIKKYQQFLLNLFSQEFAENNQLKEVTVASASRYYGLLKLEFSTGVEKSLLKFIFEQLSMDFVDNGHKEIIISFRHNTILTNKKDFESFNQKFSTIVNSACEYHEIYQAIRSDYIIKNLIKFALLVSPPNNFDVYEVSSGEKMFGEKHFIIRAQHSDIVRAHFMQLSSLASDFFIETDEASQHDSYHFLVNESSIANTLYDFVTQINLEYAIEKYFLTRLAAKFNKAPADYDLTFSTQENAFEITGPMNYRDLNQLSQSNKLVTVMRGSNKLMIKQQGNTRIKVEDIQRLANMIGLDPVASQIINIESPIAIRRVRKVKREEAVDVGESSRATYKPAAPITTYSMVINGVKRELAANEVIAITSSHGFCGYRFILCEQETKDKLDTLLKDTEKSILDMLSQSEIKAVGPVGETGLTLCKNVKHKFIDDHPIEIVAKIKECHSENRIFLKRCTFFISSGNTEIAREGLTPIAIGKHNQVKKVLT